MARKVFFSFHYADVWRVMQIRNCWVVRGEKEATGFVDKADFEKVERQGAKAITNWIDDQLTGTSTTIVLIGQETASRPYVRYEILQSYNRGNGLLGIRIHNMKDEKGESQWFGGSNPFDAVEVEGGIFGNTALSNKLAIPIYDWATDDGRKNIASWIDRAPRKSV